MPDADDDHTKQPAAGVLPPARRRRCRQRKVFSKPRFFWWLAVPAGTLALLLAVALFVLTRPSVLTPFLRAQIEAASLVETRLDSARLSLGGVLELEGLSLLLPPDPEHPGEAFRDLLDVERLTLRVGRRDLLRGRINLRRIEVQGPTLHGVLDGRDGQSNLQAWVSRFFEGEGEPGEPGPVRLPPAIEVRDAILDLRQLDPEGLQPTGVRQQLAFNGEVVPRGTGPAAELTFSLTGGDGDASARPTLEGRWAPNDRQLRVTLKNVNLASPLGLLMPPAAREYWRELAPEGDLPAVTVETQLDRSGAEAVRRARLQVENLSFRLPLASLGLLPEGERPEDSPRMTGVTGEVIVEDGHLHTTGVVGEVDGIRARLSGTTALSRGGDVSIVFETDSFDVPADPPFLFRLPGLISRIYSEYRPSGRFSARVEVARVAGEPIDVRGRLRAMGARAVFHGFTFPLEQLEGELVFLRNRLELRNLAADGPDGGRVVLDGWITDPGPEAAMSLAIRTRSVPVNEALLAALDPDLRETVGNFFSSETAERITAEWPAPSPLFEPGGELNGTVRVIRDLSVRPKSWVELDLDPEGLRVMMPAFAYPLTIRSGSLELRPGEMRVNDVVATGITGGAGVVRGRIDFGTEGNPPAVDLRIGGMSLPIDDVLLAAIGPEAARWLRRLGLRGRVTGGGLIGGPPPPGGLPPEAPPDRLGLALDLRVDDAQLGLWGNEVTLDEVSAAVRVGRDAVRLDRVSGRWPGGGRLFADGRIDLPGGQLRLDLEGEGIGIDDRLALLIPPEIAARENVRELLLRYEVGGTTDATVSLRSVGKSGSGRAETEGPAEEDSPPEPAALTWSVRTRPSALSGLYDGRRVELDRVTGLIDFTEEAAEIRSLAGRSAATRVRLSGDIPYDPRVPTELSLGGSGNAADDFVQAFLPAAVRDAMVAAALNTDFTLSQSHLRLGPATEWTLPGEDGEAPPTNTTGGAREAVGSLKEAPPLPFDFVGRLGLSNLEASVGMAVTDGRGSVDVRARGGGEQLWPQLRAETNDASMLYAERKVENLRFIADNDLRPAVVSLRGLAAKIAGGRLGGGGEIRLGEDAGSDGPPAGAGSYRLDLTLEGALAERVLFPEEAGLASERSLSTSPPAGDAANRRNPGLALGVLGNAPRPSGAGAATAPPERRGPAPGGRLWASLTAEGKAGEPESVTGRGNLRIRGGDLLPEQSGIALLRAINLGLPTEEPLGDADANVVVADGQIRVRDASVRGPGLSLGGDGWIELPSGRLYLALFTSRETRPIFRGLQRVFDTIKDEFIGIEVVGTVWEPEARVSTLAALRGEVVERIGETSAPRIVARAAGEVERSAGRSVGRSAEAADAAEAANTREPGGPVTTPSLR